MTLHPSMFNIVSEKVQQYLNQKDFTEKLKTFYQYLPKTSQETYLKGQMVSKIRVCENSSGVSYIILMPHSGYGFSFYIKPTESCCAMDFLYGFTYNSSIFSEEDIHNILDICIPPSIPRSRRIMVNMVEHRATNKHDPLEVIEPIEKPCIDYPHFHTWFQKNAAKINTMLMPNPNTGAIIHHMEVIFK